MELIEQALQIARDYAKRNLPERSPSYDTHCKYVECKRLVGFIPNNEQYNYFISKLCRILQL